MVLLNVPIRPFFLLYNAYDRSPIDVGPRAFIGYLLFVIFEESARLGTIFEGLDVARRGLVDITEVDVCMART